MKRKKYLMLNKPATIQKVIAGMQRKQNSIKVPEAFKDYKADIVETDGFLWIALDDLLEVFPMPMSWWSSDENLEIYKEIEKERGLFPVREM